MEGKLLFRIIGRKDEAVLDHSGINKWTAVKRNVCGEQINVSGSASFFECNKLLANCQPEIHNSFRLLSALIALLWKVNNKGKLHYSLSTRKVVSRVAYFLKIFRSLFFILESRRA